MTEEQIKSYYERIEKLLNGSNKITYGFAPEEIRQMLRWYEELQRENQQLKDRINKAIEYIENTRVDNNYMVQEKYEYLLEILKEND